MSRQQNRKGKQKKKETYGKRDERSNTKGSGKAVRGKSEDVGIGSSDNSCVNHTSGGDNDVSWYMKNEQLFKDASSYWVSQVTGSNINRNLVTSQGLTAVDYTLARKPGIMAINWVPSVGLIQRDDSYTSSGSPFQAFAKNVYNFMTHANSRSNVSYEAADIAMTVLAADSIYSAISAGVRAYGIARSIVQQNRYYGEAMVEASGFDAASVVADLAGFRMKINYLIAKASTIWVPSDIDLIKRHYWMNTNVYSDSEDVTGQCYLFRQKVYYLWNPKTSTQGSMLTPIVIPTAGQTVSQWYTMVTSMIEAILNDDDPQTMMGDMLKAYGAENLFALQPITEDYTVLPTHNYEVLLQIHNLDIHYFDETLLGALTIEQNVTTQSIFQIYDHTNSSAGNTLTFGYVGPSELDFPSGYDVTKESVMIATRLKCVAQIAEQNSVASLVLTTGTEFCTISTFYQYDGNGLLNRSNMLTTVPMTGGNITTAWTRLLEYQSMFDFAPFAYGIEWTDTTAFSRKQMLWAIMGDNNNGRPIMQADLERLHQVAILSELNVPFMK